MLIRFSTKDFLVIAEIWQVIFLHDKEVGCIESIISNDRHIVGSWIYLYTKN